MKNIKYSGIHISKHDYLRLPFTMRYIDNGPMVLTSIGRRPVFVRAIITN